MHRRKGKSRATVEHKRRGASLVVKVKIRVKCLRSLNYLVQILIVLNRGNFANLISNSLKCSTLDLYTLRRVSCLLIYLFFNRPPIDNVTLHVTHHDDNCFQVACVGAALVDDMVASEHSRQGS